MYTNLVNVLLVDDDLVDVESVKRSFAEHDISNPLYIASDGVEALDMLRGENGRDRLPRPYLILLDLNMPRMNGFEFLDEIRSDPELAASVVFVITTSSAQPDIAAAYERQVAGYMVKQQLGEDFAGAAGMLEQYWKAVVLNESN